MDNEESEGMWDAEDIAKFFKSSTSWAYQQAAAGKLPCVKIGGLLRFDPKVIKAIARGERVGGARIIALPIK